MQDIVVDAEGVHDAPQVSSASGPVRSESSTAPPRKKSEVRRAVKACAQCKSRKQRCSGPSSIPCARCSAAKRSCSFSFGIDDAYREDLEDSATASLDLSVRTIAEIKFELSRQRQRIENLEALLGTRPQDGLNDDLKTTSASPSLGDAAAVDSQEALHHDGAEWADGSIAAATENQLELAQPPELPSLRGVQMSIPYSVLSSMDQTRPSEIERSQQDPVKAGLIDMAEAQMMFDIFWTQCHPMCAVLDCTTQRQAFQVSSGSPFLFTLVCSIASRFWIVSELGSIGLHPMYWQIVELADRQISEIILQPKACHLRLETLQALLLYCQYSPLQPLSDDGARTRFSDSGNSLLISAALRLAKILQLQDRIMDYPRDVSNVTADDMRFMRVWINLISVDHILSLSANVTPSIDPSLSMRAIRNFASHPSRSPLDFRMASLIEVVVIVHRVAQDTLQRPLAQTGTGTLRRVNEELAEWERRYLRDHASFSDEVDRHGTFPLTTSRWYRLVLNSSSAGLYTPDALHSQQSHLRLQLEKEALSTAVIAAAETLWRFSTESMQDVEGGGWKAHFAEPLTVNIARARALAHSTDSYWLTHSFAGALLAIAFDRGIISTQLDVLDTVQLTTAEPTSPLRRLLNLAVAMVECVLSFSLHHPASAYLPYFKAALQTCTPITAPVPPTLSAIVNQNTGDGTDQSLDSLLQLLAPNEHFNLDAFRDTIFSQPWEATWNMNM